jgi:fumarate reductase flavoprotein subunit
MLKDIVLSQPNADQWDIEADIVVIGAGGCGMVASLAAAQRGTRVLLLEKTSHVGGNTSLSQGMIPAAGTRFQREVGIVESPKDMARDIFGKNQHESDPKLTLFLCEQSKYLVEWLVDTVGVELRLVSDFKYPGHTQFRMHAPPTRTGRALVERLQQEVTRNDLIQLVLNYPIRGLVTNQDGAVTGIIGGASQKEYIRCRKVILACNGFGANRTMLKQHCPEISNALLHNHPGNTGDGIRWGIDLGAQVEHMGAYQGHASVAYPQSVLVTWAVIMNGGILVNKNGERIGDETAGYSELAVRVLDQPEGLAYHIFNESSYHQAVERFEEFRNLVSTGAVRTAKTIRELATTLGINVDKLARTIKTYSAARNRGVDEFGRKQFGTVLYPPLYGVQVTGALFHTQGGLKINTQAQILRPDGTAIPNLYAGGGTAVGISGSGASGYLSGNGLLTALGWGKIAGENVART